MKTTRHIYYWIPKPDSEVAAAWAIAIGLTLVVWGGVILVAGAIF